MLFSTAQNDTQHLGYFCNKISCQEIPNIAQSGHTTSGPDDSFIKRLGKPFYKIGYLALPFTAKDLLLIIEILLTFKALF